MQAWIRFGATVALVLHAGCSSGGGEQATPRTDPAVVPIEELASVSLTAGVPRQVRYVTALPPTTVTGFEVDLLASLARLTTTPGSALRLAAAAVGGETVTVRVRVAAAAELETVCTTGHLFGVYEIGLDALLAPISAAPAKAVADGTTLAVLNAGPWVTCLEITSPADATFSLSGVEVTVTHDCAAPSADFSGAWVGTWSCTSSCGATTGGSISLTVTQEGGGRARYLDDGGDEYTGAVCGAELRFVSNTSLETERGTLRLTSGGAEKRSHWRGTQAPFCNGDCVDTLHRP